MTATEAIKEIMGNTEPKTKLSDVAFAVGVSSQVIYERLTQKNISVAKLDEIARVLGYKVVLVPKDMRIADGMYKIE